VRLWRRRERAELRELRDEVSRLRTELVHSLDDVRVSYDERDTELARALRRVADACQIVAGRVEGERAERAALVESVNRLTLSVASTLAQLPPLAGAPRHRVLGGTIDPDLVAEADGASEGDRMVDVTPEVLRHEAVEVHCRFGDRWVGGFEVVEVVPGDGGAVYRLRRRSDDSVLPTLFDERDVRFRVSLSER
jgi:hypothetical protein